MKNKTVPLLLLLLVALLFFSRKGEIPQEMQKQLDACKATTQDTCYLQFGESLGKHLDVSYNPQEIPESELKEAKEQIEKLISLCDEAPEAMKDNCFNGLLNTDFKKVYKSLKIYNERVEQLLPAHTTTQTVEQK